MSETEPKKTVLVVDDSEDFLRLLKGRLEMVGYRVCVVGSGEEALKIMPELRPNVILMDIHMPRMNGLEVLKKIRAKDKTLPIFIITATSGKTDFAQASKLGASGYLVKGADLAEEIKKIQSILNLSSKYKTSSRTL